MWRAFYDYAGGIVTDQGVHIGDVVHWYMKAREPLSVTASTAWIKAYKTDQQLPDSFAITWKYPKFVMTFSNAYMPHPEFDATSGNYFYGRQGALHVNRTGYVYKPTPTFDMRTMKMGGPAHEFASVSFTHEGGPADKAHVRNFLDCVKSREKPLTDMETGFYSTLPLLLGVLAIQTDKTHIWNGKQAVACSV